jgi:hypothetical protein
VFADGLRSKHRRIIKLSPYRTRFVEYSKLIRAFTYSRSGH